MTTPFLNVNHSIANLNNALRLYASTSKSSIGDILTKQGRKLIVAVYRQEKAIMAPKGAIKAMNLARLKSGRMISIRPFLRQVVGAKRLNDMLKPTKSGRARKFGLNVQQETVRREIALRSQGRGFISQSAKYPRGIIGDAKAVSRGKFLLSSYALKLGDEGGFAKLAWNGVNPQGSKVSKALDHRKPKAALLLALKDVTDDIMIEVNRKAVKAAAAGVAGFTRAGGGMLR